MLPFGVNGEDCGWSCWPGRGGVDGGGIWPAALQGGVGCRWPEERVGGCMYQPLSIVTPTEATERTFAAITEPHHTTLYTVPKLPLPIISSG